MKFILEQDFSDGIENEEANVFAITLLKRSFQEIHIK